MYCSSQRLYCISMFCSSACLKREWMINIYTYAYTYIYIYKSQFSVQWKSHTLVLLCLKPSQLLLLVLSESCVCFSLTHFRPKSLSSQLFGLTSSSSSSWTGLDCGGWRREESSYSSHSHLVHCLLSSCCVALGEPCFPIYCILLWVEWHLFGCCLFLFCFLNC